MQEWLQPKLVPGARVLDVGCGSGYLCAAFFELVGGRAGAKVVGVEHVEQLCQAAAQNLGKYYA